MAHASLTELRLVEHVDRLPSTPADPARLGRLHDAPPARFEKRFGHVLDYMARVELEVDRNVLELTTMLPDPPEIDRGFYADVWQPQEIQHGLILDPLQVHLGRPPAETDLTRSASSSRSSVPWPTSVAFQDVCRMLYYLTGMATERSAVLAYNLLYSGVVELGETPSRRRSSRRSAPGARPLRVLPALRPRSLGPAARWQRWLVRRMRTLSFAPGRRQQPRDRPPSSATCSQRSAHL